MNKDDVQIERIHPIMLHCILSSLRRYERDFYTHICRSFHLDADRIMGLFSEVDSLAPAQLTAILVELREHMSYHDIVHLAGRNAFIEWCDAQKVSYDRPGGGSARFRSLLEKSLPPFLGNSSQTLILRGNLHFVELSDSIFARSINSLVPLCGFYAGFLEELASSCVPGNAAATEPTCKACDPEASTCLIEVSF